MSTTYKQRLKQAEQVIDSLRRENEEFRASTVGQLREELDITKALLQTKSAELERAKGTVTDLRAIASQQLTEILALKVQVAKLESECADEWGDKKDRAEAEQALVEAQWLQDFHEHEVAERSTE